MDHPLTLHGPEPEPEPDPEPEPEPGPGPGPRPGPSLPIQKSHYIMSLFVVLYMCQLTTWHHLFVRFTSSKNMEWNADMVFPSVYRCESKENGMERRYWSPECTYRCESVENGMERQYGLIECI